MKKYKIENKLWNSGIKLIAGVDEVGRGPLAGPVVACACILPAYTSFPLVKDSKALSADKRKKIYAKLINDQRVIWAIEIIDHKIIDEINILQATLLAMQKAVEKLAQQPDFVLVDGRDLPKLQIPGEAIIKGDQLCQSISAASIIAKVIRDAIMEEMHEKFLRYNFQKNKGYGTAAHLKALQEYGACEIHRRSFAPIKFM
jgi:ribonuclease HII